MSGERNDRVPDEAPEYVLIPISESSKRTEGSRQPATMGLILTVVRRWKLIFLGAVVAALMTFATTLMMAPSYESKATLILRPPRFSSELKPEPLTLETYQRLAQSDVVLSRLRGFLDEKLDNRQKSLIQNLRAALSVNIFPVRESDRPGSRQFMPLLELVVTSPDPDLSATVANAWASVCLERLSDFNSLSRESTLDFIESQYETVRRSLGEDEENLRKRQDYYGRQLLETSALWSQRLLDLTKESKEKATNFSNETQELRSSFEIETEKLRAEYEKETDRLKYEYLAKAMPDRHKRELALKSDKLSEFQASVIDTELSVKTTRDTLDNVKEEISTQPQFLVLKKAISDEALWDRIGKEGSRTLPEDLARLKLETELLNPVHQNLLNRLISTQISLDTLVPQREHLRKEIESIIAEINLLEKEVAKNDVEFSALLKERALGLANLLEERATALAKLKANRQLGQTALEAEYESKITEQSAVRDNQLEILKRARDFEVERLSREREVSKKTFTLLAEKYQSARLAKAEGDPDLSLGARAVPPIAPERLMTRGLAIAVAFLLGLVLTAAVALIFEVGGVTLARLRPSVQTGTRGAGDPATVSTSVR